MTQENTEVSVYPKGQYIFMIREYVVNLSIITRFPWKYLEILWHESLEYNFPIGKTQQPIFKLKTVL